MPATPSRALTLADYLALDDELRRHAELVDGVLVEVNPPFRLHQRMARNLLIALSTAAPSGYEVLQEWGWVTRPGNTAREPDLVVVPSDLVDANVAVLEEPPLLAVEILSPDSGIRDTVEKREEYAAAGLGLYLVVSPAPSPSLLLLRRAAGGRLREDQFVVGSTPLTLPSPFDPETSLVPAELADRPSR